MKLIFHLPEGKIEEFSTDKSSVSVGRGNTCDIVLPYEGFSRRHAQIEVVSGEIFVTDLGSTNGVHIDGQKIPTSERTPMQSFLNLQIGPAFQIEIIDEDAAAPSAKSNPAIHSEVSRARVQRPIDSRDQTKTTRLDPRFVKKPGEKKEQEKSKLTLMLVPILIICAGAFYYMSGSEDNAPANATSQPTEAPVIPVSEAAFLSGSLLESLDKGKGCAAEKATWCEDAGVLGANQEGVAVEGKSLIVYMNMTLLSLDKHADSVESLAQKDRLEILILRRIFNSVLVRTLSRQTAIDNVQVVGGMMEHEQWKLKVAVKIRRDIDMKKVDKFKMYELFDQILNQGEVAKLSEISSFYEKLPLE